MWKQILVLLMVLPMASALVVELPSDTPYKNVSGNTITTEDWANWIYPNYSLHHYILKIPSASINVQITEANFEKILTRGNLTLPKLYPITNETKYLKTIGQNENGTNTTRNYTIYTGGAATNTLNTAVARNYIVEFQTEAWVSGHYNLTAGAIKFDPDVTACGTLSASTSYILTANISAGAGVDCITLSGNNVLNLNGNSITVNTANKGAIQFNQADNNTIANGTLVGNAGAALYMIGTENNTIYNISANATTGSVFLLSSEANYNNISNITAKTAQYIINLGSGSSNNFSDIKATVNSSSAIPIDIATNNNILKNITLSGTSNNGVAAIRITGSGNILYWNNITTTPDLWITNTGSNNFFNSSTEGNIWQDVINNSVPIAGIITSSGFPQLYIGTTTYTNTSTSRTLGNVTDNHPLTPNKGCATPILNNDASNTGTITWSSPDNACTNDSNLTTATFPSPTPNSFGSGNYVNTTYLNGTNWNFSIASGNTINGITVTVCKKASVNNSMSDSEVKLIKNGTIQSTNRANTSTWIANGVLCYNYGNSTDLWGSTWTPADWNNNSSGVVIAVTNRNTTNESYAQNVSVLFSGFEVAITDNFTTGGTTSFSRTTTNPPSGSFLQGVASAWQESGSGGWLVSNAVDTSACSQVSVTYLSQNDDLDLGADAGVYWVNSSGAKVLMYDPAAQTHDVWVSLANSSTAEQYRYNGFRLNFSTVDLASTEQWWIDNVTIWCNGTAWRINSSVASIDFVNISVSSSSGAAVPTMVSSELLNSTNGTTIANGTQIYGWANATSSNSTVNYTYTVYMNGTVNMTGTFNNSNQGVKANIVNITAGNVTCGSNWTLEVMATDYQGNSTRLNSSTISISCAPADTCTYSGSGNWAIALSDFCNITQSVSLPSNNISFTGSSGWCRFGNNTAQVIITASKVLWTGANITTSGYGYGVWFNATG